MSNYYSGIASNFGDLKAALINAAVAEGWTESSDELSKDGVFVLVSTGTDTDAQPYLALLGRSTSGGGDAPNEVRMGAMTLDGSLKNVTFPANYEIFIWPNEVYMVVNYDVNTYQFCAFGKSTIPMNGTGGWVAATRTNIRPTSSLTVNAITISATGGGGIADAVSPSSWIATRSTTSAALFHANEWGNRSRNYWVHSDINNNGWAHYLNTTTSTNLGNGENVTALAPLLAVSPSSWNAESALLPIQQYYTYPESKNALIVDLQYARRLRIDNYEPGQIINVGTDQWKVFPYFKKDSAERNGGQNINHTGTFGWAIRYEPD